MRTIKYVSGLLLATIGVAFTLSCLAETMRPQSGQPGWLIALLFIVLGVCPLTAAYFLFRRRLNDIPPRTCSNCGSAEQAPAGVLRRNYSKTLAHFGGWFLAAAWGASRLRQVRCRNCNTLYFVETKGSRIAGIMLWVFILLLVLTSVLD